MKQYRIAVLRGDGIGPEIVAQAIRVLNTAAERFGFSVCYEAALQLMPAAFRCRKKPWPPAKHRMRCCSAR